MLMVQLGLGVVPGERSFFYGNEGNRINDLKNVGTRPDHGLGVVPGEWGTIVLLRERTNGLKKVGTRPVLGTMYLIIFSCTKLLICYNNILVD